ncbi:MAG TPA: CGNR zinc finger domain-containing protein [Actinophytocola sp.]|uniref:CGNR zinc finger domain-containing protein n=1 Tax=Actinophytocola sp. TaxID=1872138 RepID=UPI002DB639A0|nr:CGNR zinc finger domain-containing protein [Actinophytocola sp.]HEU5471338.1 CGNR zinc finger domain-containing protein [Actinophytocola sp.]
MTHPLPAWLEPVLAFINTVDVETGTDDLASGPPALATWLRSRRAIPRTAPVSWPDHRLALDLRTGLRALALHNNGGPPDPAATDLLTGALSRLPLVAALPPTPLRPHRLPPTRAALAHLAAAYTQAVATTQWSRIRQCPATDCAWAFWDSSAKGSRRWCSMSVCGNRAKVRAFTRRNKLTPHH